MTDEQITQRERMKEVILNKLRAANKSERELEDLIAFLITEHISSVQEVTRGMNAMAEAMSESSRVMTELTSVIERNRRSFT